MKNIKHNLHKIFELEQTTRIYIRFIIETIAVIVLYSFWLIIIDLDTKVGLSIHALNLVCWCFLYNFLGLHKDRLRFSSLNSYLPILKLSIIFSVILSLECFFLTAKLDAFASIFIILSILNTLVGLRVLARQLIRKKSQKNKENILVYGISEGAIDFVNAMAFSKKYNVVGFIADTPQKKNSLSGLPVIQLGDIQSYAEDMNCKLIVIENELKQFPEHKDVLQKFDKLGLSVSYAPSMDRAFGYEVQLKAVRPEDVIGRSSANKYDQLVRSEIHQKVVLVTGAGGSIGSELCRQILQYQPKKLIVLELNEFALYSLEQEFSEQMNQQVPKTDIVYLLGSITDKVILNSIFNDYFIDNVYHAAAYKHVPIVEENIVAGIFNNVFGTKLVADLASRHGVNKFVLVSTDKAVRPTNIMGASKRLAELVVQDLAKSSKTIFTMVRFGNVLGSSGSVIPKFKSQINAGGPLTVTHQDITRYFMSIPEAAHLVLSAGTFAEGGEVYLLDMGDPVKIAELAKSMIRQHGLQPVLLDELNARDKRDNEILIKFSGLRPGEKLYEELLVDGVAEKTKNPKIFRTKDKARDNFNLEDALLTLKKATKESNSKAIRDLLRGFPISYEPTSPDEAVIPFECEPKEQKQVVDAKIEKQEVAIAERYPSLLLNKLVSSKLGLSILHYYFLLTRGKTLGVRVFVKNRAGELLLVEHTYISGWHLPGGGVDHGESIDAAAVREVYEECGVRDLQDIRLMKLEHNSNVSNRDHVAYFTAWTTQKPQITGNLEIKNAMFFSLENLPENVDATVLQSLSNL